MLGANAAKPTPGAHTFAFYKNKQSVEDYTQISSDQFIEMYDAFKQQYDDNTGISVIAEFNSRYCSLCFSDDKRFEGVISGHSLIKPGFTHDAYGVCHGWKHVKAKICCAKCKADSSAWDDEPIISKTVYCDTDDAHEYMGIYAKTAFIDAWNNDSDFVGYPSISVDFNAIDENTFSLGPYNGADMGEDYVLPTFHMMDNGLWEALGHFYELYGGISTHHAYNSKWCSICLRNNHRLHLSGNNQTKPTTVPGQNGKSTCSNKDRDGKYQLHSQWEGPIDSLRPADTWTWSTTPYCKYAQGLYVKKDFLAAINLLDHEDVPKEKPIESNTGSGVCTKVKYSKVEGSFTWDEAKAACQAKGLELATDRSADEHTALEALRASNAEWFWVGGRRYSEFQNDMWVWDRDLITINSPAFWNPNEPNNLNEKCLMFHNGPPSWNDAGCNNKYGSYAVCEERTYCDGAEWYSPEVDPDSDEPVVDNFQIPTSVPAVNWEYPLCRCTYGTPSSGAICPGQDQQGCVTGSCGTGMKSQYSGSKWYCTSNGQGGADKEYKIQCQPGQYRNYSNADACVDTTGCGRGFHMKDGECKLNVCICQMGTPSSGKECPVHGNVGCVANTCGNRNRKNTTMGQVPGCTFGTQCWYNCDY
jgi:hypothetical protein